MKRTLLLSALFAGATLSAADLSAQQGLSLNAHLNGATLELDDFDDSERGGGLGLAVGYGFNDNWSVYFNVDGSAVKFEDEDDGNERALGFADLGVRYSFGNSFSRLRPYVNVAVTGVAESYDGDESFDEEDETLSGGGITAGGGVQYFFSPALALDAGLQGTWGNFSSYEVGDEEGDVDLDFSTARLQVGVTWRP